VVKESADKRKKTLEQNKQIAKIEKKYSEFASVLPKDWFSTDDEAVGLVKSMHTDIMGKDKNGMARPFNDLKYFLFQAAQRNLNPFKQQIHAVYIWDSQIKSEKLVVITGIAGFRSIAQRSKRPLYAGSSEPEWNSDEDDKLLNCKVSVYAYNPVTGAREIVSTGVAWYDEYAKMVDEYVDGKKTGNKKPNTTWATRPKGMLAKCAEALALRQIFSDELSGLYVAEEIDHLTVVPDDSQLSDEDRKAAIEEKVRNFNKSENATEGEVVSE